MGWVVRRHQKVTPQSPAWHCHGPCLILFILSAKVPENAHDLGPDKPSMRLSMAAWIGASKIALSFHTSTTRLSFDWISAAAPLYAMDIASATTGAKAMMKSSLCRILDC